MIIFISKIIRQFDKQKENYNWFFSSYCSKKLKVTDIFLALKKIRAIPALSWVSVHFRVSATRGRLCPAIQQAYSFFLFISINIKNATIISLAAKHYNTHTYYYNNNNIFLSVFFNYILFIFLTTSCRLQGLISW